MVFKNVVYVVKYGLLVLCRALIRSERYKIYPKQPFTLKKCHKYQIG